MKCVICKMGETHTGEVTVTLQRRQMTIIVKNVPAEVCENCGEYYPGDEISAQVLSLAESVVSADSEVEILRFAA
jgi:YgiT-type zinc finger domain-containing protein